MADVLRTPGVIRRGHNGIGFLLNQSARVVNREFDNSLRHHGLRHLGLVLIRNVIRDGSNFVGGVPASYLQRRLVLAPDIVADEVSALSRGGWMVARIDGKEMYLSVTRKAENALPLLLDATHWNHERALNGFSRDEIDAFSEMLRRVIRNYDAYDGSSAGE